MIETINTGQISNFENLVKFSAVLLGCIDITENGVLNSSTPYILKYSESGAYIERLIFIFICDFVNKNMEDNLNKENSNNSVPKPSIDLIINEIIPTNHIIRREFPNIKKIKLQLQRIIHTNLDLSQPQESILKNVLIEEYIEEILYPLINNLKNLEDNILYEVSVTRLINFSFLIFFIVYLYEINNYKLNNRRLGEMNEKIEEKNIKNLSISSLFIRDSNGVLVEIPYNSLTNFIKPILQDSMKIIPESQEKNEELDFGINNIKEKIEKV